MEDLTKFEADKGLEWQLIGVNSQHQNGIAESVVKMVKGVNKSMMNIVEKHKWTMNETNTMMAEVGNILNERPIGIKLMDQTCIDYLSPNCY